VLRALTPQLYGIDVSEQEKAQIRIIYGDYKLLNVHPIVKQMQQWYELMHCLLNDGIIRLFDVLEKQKMIIDKQNKVMQRSKVNS
jgi:hypothetical protein